MRRISGMTKYFNFKDLVGGELLADGHYLGPVESKYGQQHEFKNLDGELVVLGGNHLGFLAKKHLVLGQRCKVFYDGLETMKSGKYAGKEVKKFSLEVEDEETEEAPKPKPKPKAEKVSPAASDTPPWKASGADSAANDDESDEEMFGV